MRGIVVVLSAALATGFVTAAGCGGKTDGGGNATAPAPVASAVIGAGGGTLTSVDGKASISVPANVLRADTTITVVAVDRPTIPGADVIGPAYRFGPADAKLGNMVDVTVPYDGNGRRGMVMYLAPGASTAFAPEINWGFNQGTMSDATTSLGTFVVAVPVSGASDGTSSGNSGATSSSSGNVGTDGDCVVMCEAPTNVDGGIGCDCAATCHGTAYKVECRCGECTCTQNGTATARTTVPVETCNGQGGDGLIATYTSVCGYPAAPNQLGGGGPTSGDAGGVCP